MIKNKHYGVTPEGDEITEYTLTNKHGMTVSIINYGAIITSVTVPNKNGESEELTLGFNNLSDYIENNQPCFGATIGRVAGRIRHAKFPVNNTVHHVTKNAGNHHLHGGEPGFQHVTWDAQSYSDDEACGVVLNYLSPEGEAGYPGNLGVVLSYHLTDDNELFIDYQAETDEATPVNLTNHTYWNLLGATKGKVVDHQLEIFADDYLELDDSLLPTGELIDVEGTPFDFNEPTAITNTAHDQCYVLATESTDLTLAAVVTEPSTGRKLECYTTQAGLQFYTGNHLAGEVGREGQAYQAHDGFCLEAQNWPDAINHFPDFPNCLLKPGKEYEHTICFQLYF